MKQYLAAFVLFAGLAVAQSPDVLTTDSVIKMVQAGVPSQTIIRTIQSASRVDFTFLPNDLELMGRAKVPEDVFKAMAAKSAGRPAPGVPSPSETAVQQPAAASPTPVRPVGAPGPPRVNRADADNEYQSRGMWDLDISGFAIIPNNSPSSTVGLVEAETGYFVTRGWLLDAGIVGVFSNDTQDVYLDGGGRYFFKTGNSRILPYVGASVGVNILSSSGFSDSRFLAQGGAGLRCFVARHVAIDIGYTLEYVHIAGASFSESTASAITVGFAHAFGGR